MTVRTLTIVQPGKTLVEPNEVFYLETSDVTMISNTQTQVYISVQHTHPIKVQFSENFGEVLTETLVPAVEGVKQQTSARIRILANTTGAQRSGTATLTSEFSGESLSIKITQPK